MRGESLGPFEVEREIGRGATGIVYRARLRQAYAGLRPGALLALKLLHAHVAASQRAARRLEREADVGGRVRHPNVVSFLGSGSLPGRDRERSFLAMEYVEGRTLRALLEELGRVPEALLREIALQIADGLAAIHDAGAVHRDLKPENVLITSDNQVRIMDLGMLRLQNDVMAVTGDGEFAGSLAYAAPELFRGEKAEPAADLYALGVLLYELASGRHPFRGRTPVDVIAAHLSRTPATLRSVLPSVSPFLCSFVGVLLSKDPRARPASAEDVRATLRLGERSPWWRERSALGRGGECALPEVPLGRRTSLHGRESELNALRAAWVRALAGRGASVLLVGEPGIGKSRLVAELFSDVEGTDVHVLYGAYVGDGGPGGLTVGLRRIVRAAGGPVAGLERVLGDQAPLAAPLATALGFGAAEPSRSLLPGTALHGVLQRVVDGLARERPVLWIVEDVHHARQGSVELIHTLARAAVNRRVLLLMTARPGAGEPTLLGLEESARPQRVEVSRLETSDVASILHDVHDDPGEVERHAAAIAERSAGVPLFVFALWEALCDGGRIVSGTEPVSDIPVPEAIRDVLLTRLEELTERERALLDVGAVEGSTFDPDLVARVGGETRLAVLRRLASIERHTRLVRPAGAEMRFDHHEVRELLLFDLGERERRRLNTALADARLARDADESGAVHGEAAYFVVRHHLLGERPREALPHVRPALGHLRRGFRHEAALDVCDALLAAPDVLDDRGATRVLLAMASHLAHLGRSDEQERVLEEALQRARAAGDGQLAATALSRQGALLVFSGRPEAALELLDAALALAGDCPPERRGQVIVNLGTALHRLGRLEEARDRFREALDLAVEAGEVALEGTASGALGNVSADLGQPKAAEKLQRRALMIARGNGDLEAECRAAGNLGITMVGLGRRQEALSLFERQHELALATGDRRVVARCELNRASVLRAAGRTAEARDCFERAVSTYTEVGDRQGLGMALGNFGQMLTALGDADGARHVLRRALATFEELHATRDLGYALMSLADAEREAGAPEAAVDLYERSLVQHGDARCGPGSVEAELGLGTLLIERGDPQRGRGHLARCLAVAVERGLWDVAVLAALHDARAGGSRPRALDLLARHAQALDAMRRPEACLIAWELQPSARHIDDAVRALDELAASAPPELRDALLGRALHRRIREIAADPDRSPQPSAGSPA